MNKKTYPCVFAVVFGAFFLFTPSSYAATIVSGTIATSTTWYASAGPYVVNSPITVSAGATLTISPGTVVKTRGYGFYTAQGIFVDGKLIADGNALMPIVFTSYLDDSVGGDTNGDGASSAPARQDWSGIIVRSGGEVSLTYTKLRYGGKSLPQGRAQIINKGGKVSLSNVSIGIGKHILGNDEFGYYQEGNSSSFLGDRIDMSGMYIGVVFYDGAFNLSNGLVHDNGTGFSLHSGVLNVSDTAVDNNKTVAFSVSGNASVVHSGVTASGNGTNAFVMSGTLNHNDTWTSDYIPYVINGSFSIPAGVSLNVEKGTIIKINSSGFSLGFKLDGGALNINGTKELPVYVTSFADDEVGGDANGNDFASFPKAGDWKNISINGGTMNVSHAIFRYGGNTGGSYASIYNNGGIFTGSFFTIASSTGSAFLQSVGRFDISDSKFFANQSNFRVTGGNATSTITRSSLIGLSSNWSSGVGNSSGIYVDARDNWWGDPSGPYNATGNPSGKGSSAYGKVIFTPWLLSDPFSVPEKPDPVIIIPGILGSAEKNGKWVIDPIFHTYDDLIATLLANGYSEGTDLFTLPYDWRQSNVETAHLLSDKINEVQAICECAKVDIVAHSMGGLVARQYIQSGEYGSDVDQLIFLGTPHLGAPDSYLTWEGGEVGGGGGEDFLLKLILSREAKKVGFDSLFDYVRNRPIPSVQQLLPTYNYLRDNDTSNLRVYPNNYPANTFLENLNNASSTLVNSGVRITNIVGDTGSNTINFIRVTDSSSLPLWEHGYPEGFNEKINDRGLERGKGDGTVPTISSEFITSDLKRTVFTHRLLPSNTEDVVFKKLTGENAVTLVSKWRIPNFKLLIIKILSPVDVVVVAPDGKRIGKDFSAGNEINEIDGAFYSGFLTDDEYITIPNPLDGEYIIETQGTGSGHYTVASGYISDNISADKDFTAQTEIGKMEEIKLSVDNSNPASLEIKPTDVISPEITVSSPQAKDYIRSEVLPISIFIEDAESGVFSQSLKFDDRIISSGDNMDLFFEKLGNHSVSIIATDYVGNTASTTINFRNIATVGSTISNVERAYSLGWIGNKGIKNSLVKKLGSKNENRISFKNELYAQRGKHINEQAFQLLLEDINWLVSN